MADGDGEAKSTYPPPPPFYVLYESKPDEKAKKIQPNSIAEEERVLLWTPPEPILGEYATFDRVETSGFRQWELHPIKTLYKKDQDGRIGQTIY
eukprot:36438-Amorphochlora_amoeboformis.AAC.2